jgi:hypothetical protein
MSVRLILCLVSALARVSARKRANTAHETNSETTTERGDDGAVNHGR